MPNGRGWLEGVNQLGHEGYGLQSHLHTINQVDQAIDVIVFMGMHTVNLEHITDYKNRYPDTKMVAVCYGFDQSYLSLRPYIDLWIEHNYKHDIVDNLFEENEMKLIRLPLAASTDLFKKLSVPKTHDVSFIGNFSHGYRGQDVYLDPILKLGLKGIYGGFYNYPNIPPEQLNLVYNSSKVNLNFHYESQKVQSSNQSDSIDFNSRIFDIALSSNFQLCDHPHTSHMFEDGVVYADKDGWLDTFHYYLNNEDARLEMAQKAYDICLKKHTWKARMNDFLKYVNEL